MRALAVIPVYNQERFLEEKVKELYAYIKGNQIPMDIVLSDNNSRDSSPTIANKLAQESPNIYFNSVSVQGKGANIRYSWLDRRFNDYDAYTFMDTDLATGLDAVPRMLTALESHNIVIGSRYNKDSDVSRTRKRLYISKGYILVVNSLFRLGVSDTQCGFKGIDRNTRNSILLDCRDNSFFFDTELLVRAVSRGYKIGEIPVTWHEDKRSSVKLRRDLPKFLGGLLWLKYLQVRRKL